jgi:hypothetical protein
MGVETWRLVALLALVVGFGIGLAMGGLAQRELDRLLRWLAVRRAVQATIEAMESAPAAHSGDYDRRRVA